ncbi:Ig-like domain-containing protein [Pontibacter sp. CAU 1760]
MSTLIANRLCTQSRVWLLLLFFLVYSQATQGTGLNDAAVQNPALAPCVSPTKPKITANGPTNLCFGGSVLLTATPAGTAYKWSTGATTQSITVSQEGDYTVEVTDANGCVGKSDILKVAVAGRLKTPMIVYSDPLIVCQVGSVHMKVDAQDGATYVWRKNGITVSDASNEYTATTAGVYTVDLSNFCGAVSSANRVEFKIQQPIPAFEVKASGPLEFCKGGNVKLSVPQLPDVVYTWFRDGVQLTGSTFEIAVSESGSYSAKIKNTCGTYTSSNAQQINVLPLPVAPTAQGATGCTKGTVALTAAGGSPGMYRWYTSPTGGTAIAGADGATFNTPELASTTTYYVAITNNQCESERVAAVATITTKPTAPEIIAAGDTEFCGGGAVELSTASVNNVQYRWLKNGQEIGSGTNKLQATVSGEYSLEVQNTCGATLSVNTIKVNVLPLPAPPTVQHVSMCGPGPATLTATGGAAGQYRWYESPTAATAMTDSRNGTLKTPVLQATRSYYVSIFKNGCESARIPVQVTVLPLPTAVASVLDSEVDAGQSTELSGSGGVSFSWSPSSGLSSATIANPMVTPAKTTRYTLTVTNEEGCTDTASVVISVRQMIDVPNAFSPNNDGMNDTWEIANIEYFPEAKLEVFNRWGNLVYERVNYRNDWSGIYRGAKLPVSTYFYVITLSNNTKLTGYVNIVN